MRLSVINRAVHRVITIYTFAVLKEEEDGDSSSRGRHYELCGLWNNYERAEEEEEEVGKGLLSYSSYC